MAWIIGKANKEEIEKMEAAGFEVFKSGVTGPPGFCFEEMMKGLLNHVPEEANDDLMVITYVDCDIPDLLDFSESNENALAVTSQAPSDETENTQVHSDPKMQLLSEIREWITAEGFVNGVHYDTDTIVGEIDRVMNESK